MLKNLNVIKTILSIEIMSSNNTRNTDYYLQVTYIQQNYVTKFYQNNQLLFFAKHF